MPEINFFWDPLSDNILQERDETGAVTAEYTAEPGLYGNIISQNRGGVESQFHYDAQGSTIAVTDDNQNVTDTFAYTAFGEVTERTGTTEVPFQYIGQKGYYTDSLTGQIMVRRRPYEPARARWLAADLMPTSGMTQYSYADSRPTALLDASGLAPIANMCALGCACTDALHEFLRNPPSGALNCIRNIRRCNIDIFCATSCGFAPGVANTFVAEGFVHICLPQDVEASCQMYYGQIIHECEHARQFLEADRRLCRDVEWPVEQPVGIPGPARILCRTCKDLERPAYTAQAHYLFPDPPRGTPPEVRAQVLRDRAEFISVGLCISCRHVCREYQGGPCPPSPGPLVLGNPVFNPPPPWEICRAGALILAISVVRSWAKRGSDAGRGVDEPRLAMAA